MLQMTLLYATMDRPAQAQFCDNISQSSCDMQHRPAELGAAGLSCLREQRFVTGLRPVLQRPFAAVIASRFSSALGDLMLVPELHDPVVDDDGLLMTAGSDGAARSGWI